MSMELITIIATIISANIALAGLLISGQNSLRGEMQEQRKKMQEQGKEIEGVKIEVASLRATVETYFRVRVDPPPTAAVAEPPEDYGAD